VKYKFAGMFFILSGILFNEWTFNYIASSEIQFDIIENIIIIIFFQLPAILVGIYLYLKQKKALQNIFLVFVTNLILIALLELMLSFEYFQCLSSSSPLWIPHKYKNISDNFYLQHLNEASKNKDFFNDINHSFKKKDSTQIRLAILGDSFIWGDGVPDSIVWTRKLEKEFDKNGKNVRILNWGISGWSTKDEFEFLKNEGIKYEFDFLVFTFVVNDPRIDTPQRHIFHQHDFLYRKILKPISIVFPNSISFITDLINNFLATQFNLGYLNWIKNKLYSASNLKKYSELLLEIKKYCDKEQIPFVFIMTPENHSPLLGEYFEQIIPLFVKNGIRYYNLFHNLESELKQYSIRELWANPADSHPGDKVTTIYSENIYHYLQKKDFKLNKVR